MYSNEPIKYYKNRKGKPDGIIRWLELASILVWFVFMLNISVILYAKPGEEGFFDRIFNVTVRDYWDVRFLRLSLVISIVQFTVSCVSIYLNTKRMKRKYDTMRISLFVSAFLSFALIIGLSAVLLSWDV